MGAEAAVAIIPSKERDVRDAFHKAGALDPTNAQSLADVGVEESLAFKRLVGHHVVRESAPGSFYFDEEVWREVRATRRKMGLTLLAAVVLTGLMGLYFANR